MRIHRDDQHALAKVWKKILSGAAIAGFMATTFLSVGSASAAAVAGSSSLGVTTEEVKVVAMGWSAKKKIMGKAVYNDKNEKIGVVDDLIVAPDRSLSYAIVGVGGFIGMGKHDVAIPVSQFKAEKDKNNKDKIVLAGATKDALKALPKFEYAK